MPLPFQQLIHRLAIFMELKIKKTIVFSFTYVDVTKNEL